MPLSRIQSESVNLADDFAFTGTVTGAGEITASTTAPAEGGTATTNVVQGLAKVWTTFNGQSATIATTDSFNESSLTDSGSGRYAVNFVSNMGNTGYAIAGALGSSDPNYGAGWFNTGNAHSSFSYSVTNTTSSHRISQAHAVTAGQIDYTDVHSLVHGDLA
jgi:hypothetical protein